MQAQMISNQYKSESSQNDTSKELQQPFLKCLFQMKTTIEKRKPILNIEVIQKSKNNELLLIYIDNSLFLVNNLGKTILKIKSQTCNGCFSDNSEQLALSFSKKATQALMLYDSVNKKTLWFKQYNISTDNTNRKLNFYKNLLIIITEDKVDIFTICGQLILQINQMHAHKPLHLKINNYILIYGIEFFDQSQRTGRSSSKHYVVSSQNFKQIKEINYSQEEIEVVYLLNNTILQIKKERNCKIKILQLQIGKMVRKILPPNEILREILYFHRRSLINQQFYIFYNSGYFIISWVEGFFKHIKHKFDNLINLTSQNSTQEPILACIRNIYGWRKNKGKFLELEIFEFTV